MRESHEEIVVRDNALERNFSILAESGGGLVEAIAHRDLPLYGVQFHPEKSGELGIKLLMNFLKMLTD
jgi:anthranilate synthase component 2